MKVVDLRGVSVNPDYVVSVEAGDDRTSPSSRKNCWGAFVKMYNGDSYFIRMYVGEDGGSRSLGYKYKNDFRDKIISCLKNNKDLNKDDNDLLYEEYLDYYVKVINDIVEKGYLKKVISELNDNVKEKIRNEVW